MTTTWLRRAVRVALVGLPLMPVAVMAQDADPAPDQPRYGSFGLDTALMDRDVVPGDDFFSYMEGVWVKTTRIPDDKARVGYNYDLDDKVEEDIRAIAEQAVAHPDTPGAKRIAAVYSAWMDEKGHCRARTCPVAALACKDRGGAHPARVDGADGRAGLFEPDCDRHFVRFQEPGPLRRHRRSGRTGLPAREYYLDPGEKYAAVRSAYVGYIEKIFTLAGIPDGAKKAQLILALETAVARSFWEPEKLRDPSHLQSGPARETGRLCARRRMECHARPRGTGTGVDRHRRAAERDPGDRGPPCL
jgi:endothelin-converting enzyme/putative endopeptidase